MSLSTCPECWDTPCTCGHGYKSWTVEQLVNQIEMLGKVLAVKLAKPPSRREAIEKTLTLINSRMVLAGFLGEPMRLNASDVVGCRVINAWIAKRVGLPEVSVVYDTDVIGPDGNKAISGRLDALLATLPKPPPPVFKQRPPFDVEAFAAGRPQPRG